MLVPVDRRDEGGILQQALQMAECLQCQVHLLYNEPAAAREEERQIIDYSKRHAVDLILLVKKKKDRDTQFRMGADVDRLVDKTCCPVLTTTESPVISGLKNIVLPVGDQLPMRKLLFATYLGRTVHSTIHLVAPYNNHDVAAGVGRNLQKCYRLLRENTSLSIECQASPRENIAEAAWEYANRIHADLILTAPGKESMLSGFWDSLRTMLFQRRGSRSLQNASQIPVMTIPHQHEFQVQD